VTLWKVQGSERELVGIIDYESTNSSDSRIIRRNFENYRRYVTSEEPSHNIPTFWLVLTTLPHREVKRSEWYSWDYRRKRIDMMEYRTILRNPFQYWSIKYEKEFATLESERKKYPIYIANLDSNVVKIYPPRNLHRSYPLT